MRERLLVKPYPVTQHSRQLLPDPATRPSEKTIYEEMIPAMPSKVKHDRFQRIAQERKNHVLECLHALGGCSDPASYNYEDKELAPIFEEIAAKMAEVWRRMSSRCPYPFIPFSLGQKAVLEIGRHHCNWDSLATMAEVLELLSEGGATFTALEPVRNSYTDLPGDELCWSYPFCADGHMGCVLLPVREGILLLPYDSVDRETYEQFDIKAIRLLSEDEVRPLMDALLTQTLELYGVLADIERALPSPARYAKTEEAP